MEQQQQRTPRGPRPSRGGRGGAANAPATPNTEARTFHWERNGKGAQYTPKKTQEDAEEFDFDAAEFVDDQAAQRAPASSGQRGGRTAPPPRSPAYPMNSGNNNNNRTPRRAPVEQEPMSPQHASFPPRSFAVHENSAPFHHQHGHNKPANNNAARTPGRGGRGGRGGHQPHTPHQAPHFQAHTSHGHQHPPLTPTPHAAGIHQTPGGRNRPPRPQREKEIPEKTFFGPDGEPLSQKKRTRRRNRKSKEDKDSEPPKEKQGGKREGRRPVTPAARTPAKTPNSAAGKKKKLFDEYLTLQQVEQGLQDGSLVKGTLRVNAMNSRDAYVTVDGMTQDVYIDGHYDRNRAFEGDTVVIQLNDKSKWKKKKSEHEPAEKHEKEPVDDEIELDDEEAEIPPKLQLDTKKDESEDDDDEDDDEEDEEDDDDEEDEEDLEEVDAPLDEEEEESGALVSTTFRIAYDSKFGENLYICGNIPEFGAWDASHALPMEYSSSSGFSEWVVTLPLPTGTKFEFKYVVKMNGQAKWENVPNRTGVVGESPVVYQTTWDDPHVMAHGIIKKEEPVPTAHETRREAHPHHQRKEEPEISTLTAKVAEVKLGKQEDESTEDEPAIENPDLQPSGKVVYILEAKHPTRMAGTVKPTSEDGKVKMNDRFVLFCPINPRYPWMAMPIGQLPDFSKEPESYANKLVLGDIITWGESSYRPLAKYAGILGQAGEIEPETQAIIIQHGIDAEDFPKEAIAQIPTSMWQIPPEEYKVRRDFRDCCVMTIDPPTAKDLDDALHIKRLPNGNFEVGVHIADVSHFVLPNTLIDGIAQSRSTSVYLVQKVIPMLPSILCENLCSLNPGVDRCAFSVVWTMSPKAEILSEWVGKSVIRSCSKMPYDVAQHIIEGRVTKSWSDNNLNLHEQFKNIGPFDKHTVPEIAQDVMDMFRLSAIMRKKRFDGGAVSMNNAKLSFKLDDHLNPLFYSLYITKEANHMVEEYMLLANQQVALRLAKYFPSNALLRNHGVPMAKKKDAFTKFCQEHLKKQVDISSAKAMSETLAMFKQANPGPIFYALQQLATRSMQLAKYFCTGSLPEDQWRHYALNMDRYTHFTSPIRRYADLVVHRLLQASILIEQNAGHSDEIFSKAVPSTEQVTKICLNANERKLNARKAQDDSGKLFLCMLVKKTPAVEDAVVVAIGDKFVSVLIPTLAIEHRAQLEDIVANSYSIKDHQVLINWPTTPGEITPSSVEQHIKMLSIIKVRIGMKLFKGRPELQLFILHPSEVEAYNKSGAEEQKKKLKGDNYVEENFD